MSDDTNAVDGANPAAPESDEAQETPQISANADGQEDEAKPEEKPRDEKGRFVQDRINELTKARRQAERERDAYAAQLQQQQQYQPQHQPQAQGDKPPSFEDYTDLNEWSAAVAQHATRQAEQRAERRFYEQQQHTQQAQVFSTFDSKEREYAAANPEYADAYQTLQSTVSFNPYVLEVIGTSDHGPAIVHHLGQHLDVAERVSRLPPHLAAAEIARIEARLSAPKAKPVSKAPAPAPSLSGGATAKPGLHDDLPIDVWLARRRAQLNAK